MIKNGPTADEIRKWVSISDYPIEMFFNSRGKKFKELGLKDKMDRLSMDEKIDLLSSDSMLVKRPMLISNKNVLIGFKKELWEEHLK